MNSVRQQDARSTKKSEQWMVVLRASVVKVKERGVSWDADDGLPRWDSI